MSIRRTSGEPSSPGWVVIGEPVAVGGELSPRHIGYGLANRPSPLR
ncbi:MAG: hypothetical protein LAO22_12420 [Acidobacteriia bacterium]|nr:hypothetical protein [Terriglobia bacterium]